MESHFREIFFFKRQVSCLLVENMLLKRYENLSFSNFPLQLRGKPRGILLIKIIWNTLKCFRANTEAIFLYWDLK